MATQQSGTPQPSTRAQELVGVLIAVVAAAAAVLTLSVYRVTILAFVSFAIFPLAILAFPKLRRKKSWGFVAPVLASLLIAAIGLWITVPGPVTSFQEPSVRSPRAAPISTASQLPEAESLAILEPQNGDHVPECPKVSGAGDIPPGGALWIMVKPDVAVSPAAFWFGSPARADGPHHWRAIHPVSIDTPATHNVSAQLYAVLIEKSWGDYFEQSTVEGSTWANSLPPSIVAAASPVTVARDPEPVAPDGGGVSCRQ